MKSWTALGCYNIINDDRAVESLILLLKLFRCITRASISALDVNLTLGRLGMHEVSLPQMPFLSSNRFTIVLSISNPSYGNMKNVSSSERLL